MSVEVFQSLMETLVDMQRRMGGVSVKGRVSAEHIDPKAGKVRLIIGQDDDGQDVLSPWVPYAQTAGALKVHSAPSAGQTMEISSDSGDIEQGAARPLHWSDDNKSPSEKGDEHVLTFGEAKVELRSGEIVVTVPRMLVKCGGSTFELSGSGLKMVAPDFDFSQG